MDKTRIKDFLGDLPFTAEVYWYLRQRGKPKTVQMNLKRLKKVLPGWVEQAQAARQNLDATLSAGLNAQHTTGKPRILVFGMVRFWIEHTTLISLALAGMGYAVTLAFLPYSHWRKPTNRFDLRRQNLYIKDVLRPIQPLVNCVSLFDAYPGDESLLPLALENILETRAYRDTQYSLLLEEIEMDSPVYKLRLERNHFAARSFLAYLQKNRPDGIITPNGSVVEFGMLYEVAQHLQIPVVTYEFGEQDQRMWMAQDEDVMRQDTTALWKTRGDIALSEKELERIQAMFASRRGARPWETFARQWQGSPSQGGQKIRAELGLDQRPFAFLPTNVLGDSLTLGRQVFSPMTEWLRQTVRYFIQHPEFQLVVRIHPGEQIGWGPSVYEILRESFPELPENIHLLPASARINSYDLVEAAQVGLVYTTTMGMEMAMNGKPVIVTGQTHYRGKGFTYDAETWEQFFNMVWQAMTSPDALYPGEKQVELAWRYAYRFFFEYPQPFPWHLLHYWKKLDEWPLSRVLSPEGIQKFGATFRYLAGEPIQWGQHE